jgi:hypothetical protein
MPMPCAPLTGHGIAEAERIELGFAGDFLDIVDFVASQNHFLLPDL